MSFAAALDILYEDNHVVAVNKPAGWPSAHYAGTDETMDRVVKAYLKEKYVKPGKVFLGIVHRLDKPVSGVLLFARTSKGAARLSEQFRDNLIEKVYWAVVETGAKPLPPAGSFEDWLWKDPIRGGVEVVAPGSALAKQALLHYTTKAEHDGMTLLEIRPQTGRTHQLRVQLASRGWPIYGDAKYGSAPGFGPAIGLHAREITFLHPTKQEPVTVTAAVPRPWKGRFAYLLPGVGGARMSERDALMRAILDDPIDDGPRLVFADWLTENGCGEEAEKLRQAVLKSERDHHHIWNGLRYGQHPYGRGNLPGWAQPLSKGGATVRHGFVCRVDLELRLFLRAARNLFAAHPVTAVRLSDRDPKWHFWAWSWRWTVEGPGVAAAPDVLPADLFDCLDRGRENACPEAADAMDELSRACVRYGRRLAGLSPLAWV